MELNNIFLSECYHPINGQFDLEDQRPIDGRHRDAIARHKGVKRDLMTTSSRPSHLKQRRRAVEHGGAEGDVLGVPWDKIEGRTHDPAIEKSRDFGAPT